MNRDDVNNGYDFVTKCLHWSIALLLIIQICLGIIATRIHNQAIISRLFFVHKSLGLTLLLFGIIFVLWRLCHRSPRRHGSLPTWQYISAKIVHFALFILIIVMPLSGWFMSTAAGYPPSFWGLFIIKAPVAVNHNLFHFMANIHLICAWLITILIIIHTLAALKHALIERDGTLRRAWF